MCICVCVHPQELSSSNYLDLYRLADLFHLPAVAEAVVDFLVEHLREQQEEEVQFLPLRLLREVLQSDQLTSLTEEEIWKVPRHLLVTHTQTHTHTHRYTHTHRQIGRAACRERV